MHDGAHRVVDVAGSIPNPEELSRLRQVSRERVVGRVLGVMGIETPLGAIHLSACADHRAVEVERGPGQRPLGEGREGNLTQQRIQALSHP